ncbi:MAG: M48 family peptidase [Oscillatoriales cyanobacterium]|nr:MAG: M48 family peptidase [Oscillatoriales cyanobacterium]
MPFKFESKILRRGVTIAIVTWLLTVGSWLGAVRAGYSFSLGDILPSAIEVLQLSTMSDEREVSIGSQIDAQLKANRNISIYNNTSVQQFVEDLGERLVAVSDRPDLSFTFQIVNDSSINAFATLGGFVYVNTGLIALAENEAELAGVVAHEIGHITEKHVIERMKQAAIARGVAGSTGVDDSVLVGIGYELALSLPSSRRAEYEADEVGLAMLEDAGYAPSGIVTFFEKLAAASGGGRPPTFLSTHPATESRIRRLNRQIDDSERNQGDGLDTAAYRRQVSPL